MPFTYNGIGTMYYGKKNVHDLRSTCNECNNYGLLSSYDTTCYFTFLYIPIIPLGKYRILEDCQYCRKHRYFKLSEWENLRREDMKEISHRLKESPDDPEVIKDALVPLPVTRMKSHWKRWHKLLRRGSTTMRVCMSAWGTATNISINSIRRRIITKNHSR